MNDISIQRLKQSLQHFFARYDAQKEDIIYAKFSPNLFTENWQKTAFYFQQIEQTFSALEQIENDNIEALQFYTQKLSAQCSALSDALLRQQQNVRMVTNTPATNAPRKSDKRHHPVHRLPPRERLAKYYDYLAMFNEKIRQEQDRQEKAKREYLAFDGGKLAQLQQRRARCLEHIEMLEDYLVFVESQK